MPMSLSQIIYQAEHLVEISRIIGDGDKNTGNPLLLDWPIYKHVLGECTLSDFLFK